MEGLYILICSRHRVEDSWRAGHGVTGTVFLMWQDRIGVCMLCVFRGGVLCQPALPPPLVDLWEAVYLSLSLTSPLL